MILFLYGVDTYRSRQKLNKIIEQYKKTRKSGLNLQYIDLAEQSFEDFKIQTRSLAMFQEKKLIILFNAFNNKDFSDKFLKEKQKFLDSENVIVFYEKEKADKRSKLFKFLKAKAKCQEFDFLAGSQLKAWIRKEMQQLGLTIHPQSLDWLCQFVGSDLWRMSNELRKIAAYKKQGEITLEVLEKLIKPEFDSDIFKTIEAIAAKRKSAALSLLHQHLERGDVPLYLLSMINYQFRNLLTIKDLVEKAVPYYLISKRAKLHPFVVKKSYPQVQQFDLPALKKIYQKLFKLDFQIKTGKIDPQIALDLLITDL